MTHLNLIHKLRLGFWLILGMSLSLMVGRAKILSEDRAAVVKEWRAVPVQAPEGAPAISQQSIRSALVLYNIDVPDHVEFPILNTTIEDRGLSTRLSWKRKIKVEIGASAFTSWGILGSTLAHELEIHCRQSFMLINVMDKLGLDGTAWAERQAYMHEIKNAKRFGLSEYQRDLIASTLAYYYNLDSVERSQGQLKSRIGHTLGLWLARSSALSN